MSKMIYCKHCGVIEIGKHNRDCPHNILNATKWVSEEQVALLGLEKEINSGSAIALQSPESPVSG